MENLALEARDITANGLVRRDWILLPLLSLTTIVLIAVSVEFMGRWSFGESKTGTAKCYQVTADGRSPIPNSVCWEKLPESRLTEYRFNSCGHRAGTECGPKPPGVYRIVVVGASYAFGSGVAQQETFPALLPVQLSRKIGRRIEVYNEAVGWNEPHRIAQNFHAAVEEAPDMILWVITPYDIGADVQFAEKTPTQKLSQDSTPAKVGTPSRIKAFVSRGALGTAALNAWHDSKANFFLRHFLYESQDMYMKTCLTGSMSSGREYLRSKPDQQFQETLRVFAIDAADIEKQANAAGIPIAAVLLPERAQAAMISMGKWPDGYDPYQLDNDIRHLVASNGGIALDILPYFRNTPNPEQYFFPVDGHPDPRGHRLLAGFVADAIIAGALPPSKASTQMQQVSANAKR